MAVEDEPRFQKIIKGNFNQWLIDFMRVTCIAEILSEWIAAGEVPEYKLFPEESNKRARRHNKYRKEALEARQLQQEIESWN